MRHLLEECMHAVCLLTWPYKSLQCSGEHAPCLLASTRLGLIFKRAVQNSGRPSFSFSLESSSVWNPKEILMKFQYRSTKSGQNRNYVGGALLSIFPGSILELLL